MNISDTIIEIKIKKNIFLFPHQANKKLHNPLKQKTMQHNVLFFSLSHLLLYNYQNVSI